MSGLSGALSQRVGGGDGEDIQSTHSHDLRIDNVLRERSVCPPCGLQMMTAGYFVVGWFLHRDTPPASAFIYTHT